MELAIIIAILATIAGQLTKGIAGFGAALVSLPLLFMVWAPSQAIFIMLCVDITVGIYLLWNARREVLWTVVLAMLIPSIAGQYIGTELLLWMPEQITRWALAVLVLGYGLRVLLFAPPQGHGGATTLPESRKTVWAWAALAGLSCGLLAGSLGAGGPPVVAFVRRWFTNAVGRA
ncbi:MAG: putative membrane protein YfcA, partial [Kiritimatiellia bacterium]